MKYVLIGLDKLVTFALTIIVGIIVLIVVALMIGVVFLWHFKFDEEIINFGIDTLITMEESIHFEKTIHRGILEKFNELP